MKTGVKIIIAILIAAIVAFGALRAIKSAKAREAKIPVATIYPIVVQKYMPHISQVKLTLPAITVVKNDKNVALSPLISARILKIKLSGQRVKKGEVLATLDTTMISSKIRTLSHQADAALVALKNLQAAHKRTDELLRIKGASIEQYDKEATSIAEMRSKLSALQEQKRALENELTYAVIKSPVNGVISKVFFNKGDISIPGHPLVAISADNGFYLLLRVPADVPVHGLVFRGKTYPAIALFRTYNGLLEYKIYIADKNLITDDRVEADVVTYDKKGVFLPFDAVLNNDGHSYVLVIQNHQAVAKKIDIIQNGQEGVVASGVALNKAIVLAKPDILLKLTSGCALQVKE